MQASGPSAAATDELTDGLLGFMSHLGKTTDTGVFDLAVALDLTLSQLRALHVLQSCDHDLAVGELAPAVGLSVAATGRLVDALVRGGLVSRREDDADRRIKRVALTGEGVATMDRLVAARREGLRQFVETLDDDAREHLARALAALPTPTHCRSAGTETDTPS